MEDPRGSNALVCLSGAADAQHWSTDTGAVVIVYDAKVIRDGGMVAINKADSLRVLGYSTDLGLCNGVNGNGAACGAPVHRGKSLFCSNHVGKALRQIQKENKDLGPIQKQVVKGPLQKLGITVPPQSGGNISKQQVSPLPLPLRPPSCTPLTSQLTNSKRPREDDAPTPAPSAPPKPCEEQQNFLSAFGGSATSGIDEETVTTIHRRA
eukprot:PhF_6_TR31144/c0_g1_i1/m.45619